MLQTHETVELNPPRFFQVITHFSRQLPEVNEADILKVGPAFFKMHEKIYAHLEKHTKDMYEHGLQRFIKPEFREVFRKRIEEFANGNVLEYDPSVKEIISTLVDSGKVGAYDGPLLEESALNYLGARRSISYMRELSGMQPEEFQKHFALPREGRFKRMMEKLTHRGQKLEIKYNRTEAARHFERLTRINTTVQNYKLMRYEEKRYAHELPRLNGLKIPGMDHHLIVTEKPAFFSIRPSVFGGDNIHIEHVTLKNGESRVILFKTDIRGHAEHDHSMVNHVRNHIIGVDERDAKNGNNNELLETPKGTEQYLREHVYAKDVLFASSRLEGTCIAEVFNPHTGQSHAIFMGEGAPLVAHPEKGIIELTANVNPHLGIYADFHGEQAKKMYEITKSTLPESGVKLYMSDLYENKDGRLFPGEDTYGYPASVISHFEQLVKNKNSAREIAEGVHQQLTGALKGAHFDDDGRIETLRFVKKVRIPFKLSRLFATKPMPRK